MRLEDRKVIGWGVFLMFFYPLFLGTFPTLAFDLAIGEDKLELFSSCSERHETLECLDSKVQEFMISNHIPALTLATLSIFTIVFCFLINKKYSEHQITSSVQMVSFGFVIPLFIHINKNAPLLDVLPFIVLSALSATLGGYIANRMHKSKQHLN